MANIFHWIMGCSETVNCYLQTRTNKQKNEKERGSTWISHKSEAKRHWLEQSQQKHGF